MQIFYINIILLSFVITQGLKMMNDARRKQFHWTGLFHYGGMPSAHTASVVSLLTALGMREGITSPLFAICLLFGVMVIVDAVGIRRFLATNAETLAKVIAEEQLPPHKLYLRFGHTPAQACVGAVIGFTVALGYMMYFAT